MDRLVIFGAWYFGRVVEEAAVAAGWDVLGFVDPDPPRGVVTLDAVPRDALAFAAIGDNGIRSAVNAELLRRGRRLGTIVHPTASVSPSAVMGAGSYAGELAVVRTRATIGDGVVLQAGSVVSHDSCIESHVSFGPNAAAASKVTVGSRTAVGVGGVIAPGLDIGQDCTVAAGAAVFRDCTPGVSLVGNPARATPSPAKEVMHSDWGANGVW